MKKTLIINIGNSIIHFEEDAFEVLTGYLNKIKAHFAHSADNFEIVSDIEQRIAEILREQLTVANRQVVTLSDVDLVVARMGTVSDFEEDEKEPAADFDSYKGIKRLYRNTDDMLVAGVCSGLGQYLNIETRWMRLAFLLTLFFAGSGLLIYAILWVVMPPAISRAEKMAMRGEPANLQGFKRNYEEELAAFAEHVKKKGAEFEPYVKRTGGLISELVVMFGDLLGKAVKILFKIVAVLVIAWGFVVMIALLLMVAVTLGLGDTDMFGYFPLNIVNRDLQDSMLFAGFVTCFVPVLALVLFSIRVAFNRRAINKTLSFALLTVWLCGAGFTAYYVTVLVTEFREYAEVAQPIAMETKPAYYLDVNKQMMFSKADSVQFQLNKTIVGRGMFDNDGDFENNNGVPRNVRIQIEKSNGSTTSLIRYDRANGRNFKQALENSRNIDYRFSKMGDTLLLATSLSLKHPANWRAQEVKLVLSVPVGTILWINSDLNRSIDFYAWSCESNARYTKWLMTENGLVCQELNTEPAE